MAAVIGALRVNLGLNSADFENGMKKVKGGLDGLAGAFAALGGVALFAGLTASIGEAVGRIEETRRLTDQLDQALANTGNTAKTSGSEIADFADQLERSTGRAAEEILAVGTNLATFGFSRKVFFDAIELANDMSAAWGGDLRQNVEGLARALADPEKGLAMLTKRGITFTAEQKKLIAGFIKANDLIGAQGVVLDALNAQVKGVAAAGFTGLTAAQARATKATEDFFETVANALGVNTGLEMSLVGVAAALDFMSQNFGTIAKAAGVAGAAILTALGPAIWTAISSAATSMATAVIGGLRAIAVAATLNPIGLIVVALAAAVTAAFLFRDEIKQAIGIDFVGIIGAAVNAVIGAFVGAFNAIKATWAQLPAALGDLVIQGTQSVINAVVGMVKEAISILNDFLTNVNGLAYQAGLGNVVGLLDIEAIDYAKLDNPFAGAAEGVSSAVSTAFSSAQVDYVGQLGAAFSSMGDAAAGAASKVAGFSQELDGAGSDAGAVGGTRKLGSAADDTKSRLSALGDVGQSVASTLSSGFREVFKGLVSGSGNAVDAVGKLLDRLGDLFLDQAFNTLFSGFGGGGGLFGGFGKMLGFARGGTILPGGSGGIDSQLVMFRKSPNERVDVTKPGQALMTGSQHASSGDIHIQINGSTLTQEQMTAAIDDVLQHYDRYTLPRRVNQINQDPLARG